MPLNRQLPINRMVMRDYGMLEYPKHRKDNGMIDELVDLHYMSFILRIVVGRNNQRQAKRRDNDFFFL